MTKQEFERRMEEVEELTLTQGDNLGLCGVLNLLLVPNKDFKECFTPERSSLINSCYWLNDCFPHNQDDNMTQLERRLVFLESFKGFCECYKLYESW